MGRMSSGGLVIAGIFIVIVGALLQSSILEWLLDIIGFVVVVIGVILVVYGLVKMFSGGNRTSSDY